ncbi:MAG: polysaccharide biosynthesis C-terminal domain-containing protein [Magnetococcales bacterium]|nr:polysaccharide biosynthesis C-terminal domain-containing protein [Magnetococcales bacterium]
MEQIKPNSLFKNATWNTLNKLWVIGLMFFLTPFMIHKLGTPLYSLMVLVSSISVFMSIMNFGFGDAAVRFVAYDYAHGDIEGINLVISTSMSLFLALGLCVGTALYLGAGPVATWLGLVDHDHPLAMTLLRIAAAIFIVETVSVLLGTIPVALQRYDITAKLSIGQSMLQSVGTITLLWMGYQLVALMIWNFVVVVVMTIVRGVVARRVIPGIRFFPSLSRLGLRRVLSYSLYSSLTGMLSIIWLHMDRVMVSAFAGPGLVAFLSIPQQLATRGNSVATGISGVLFPRFSSLNDDKERARPLFLHATWIMLVVTMTLFIPAAVLLPDFLTLWINADFARQSATVGQIILGSFIWRGAFYPVQMVFGAFNKPQYLTLYSLINLTINFIVNVTLIPRYGLNGAGYAFLASGLTGFFFVYWAWRHLFGVSTQRFPLTTMVLPVGMGIGLLAGLMAVSEWIGPATGWFFLVLRGGGIVTLVLALFCLTDHLLMGRNGHFHAVRVSRNWDFLNIPLMLKKSFFSAKKVK